MALRGSSSEQARAYRQRGHDNALRFAHAIGLDKDYRNDRQAKKDVIDPSGDAHSLKSGAKKWQIFLYSRSRFESDDGFQALNGVGSLLIHCIDAFPPSYEDYRRDPRPSKERLRTPMRELKDRFQRKALLRAFLMKSIFNGGEVNYLTVLHSDDRFHVFRNTEVIALFGRELEVTNSTGNPPEQKVLFRRDGRNLAELEMRNDSKAHYQEIRLNMLVEPAMECLLEIEPVSEFSPDVICHGEAIKTFGNWDA